MSVLLTISRCVGAKVPQVPFVYVRYGILLRRFGVDVNGQRENDCYATFWWIVITGDTMRY